MGDFFCHAEGKAQTAVVLWHLVVWSMLQLLKLFVIFTEIQDKSRTQCRTKLSVHTVWLQRDPSDISDWQCCITLREGALICTLSQTAAVIDLESPMPNVDYKATWRTEEKEEEEEDSGVRERRNREGRVKTSWDMKECAIRPFTPAPPCLFPSAACGKEKHPGNQSSWWSTWWWCPKKQTKHYFAFDVSRCSFSSLQEYFDNMTTSYHISPYAVPVLRCNCLHGI